MELICISNDLTQVVNFPTWIPDQDSHSPALLDLFISSDASISSEMTFSPLEKFWSCSCLSFHQLSIKLKMGYLVPLHSLSLSLCCLGWSCWSFWEMFHGRISLNLVLLLLLVNFVSAFWLELMYTSLIINVRSSFTYLYSFQLLVLLP